MVSHQCRLRCVLQFKPHIFIHENVVGFPDAIIHQILGSVYTIETVLLNSLSHTLPISHKRKYSLRRLGTKLKIPGNIDH